MGWRLPADIASHDSGARGHDLTAATNACLAGDVRVAGRALCGGGVRSGEAAARNCIGCAQTEPGAQCLLGISMHFRRSAVARVVAVVVSSVEQGPCVVCNAATRAAAARPGQHLGTQGSAPGSVTTRSGVPYSVCVWKCQSECMATALISGCLRVMCAWALRVRRTWIRAAQVRVRTCFKAEPKRS